MTQQVLSSAGSIKESNSFGNAGYGTSLPASPTDGMEYILVDSVSLPTYQWRFRWNNGSSNTDKWEFVGGTPALVAVATSEGTASTTYAALATAGPSFTVPRAGVYEITQGCKASAAATNVGCAMSYDIGGSGAVDADGLVVDPAFHTGLHAGSGLYLRSKRQTLSASTALVSKYKSHTTAGTATFEHRTIAVLPVRLS